MTTVTLICSECESPFAKDKHEVARRKYKGGDNWFCSRSCGAKHRNKTADRTGWKRPDPQVGNQHSRKYHPFNSWYISRAFQDQRTRVRPSVSRDEYDSLLSSLWTGKCALTGVPIFRRDGEGKCEVANPFNIASVDRIDSSIPYQPGNIQWVSQAINLAKSDDPLFVDHLKDFLAQL